MKKYKIIISTYAIAAIIALGAYSFVSHNMLQSYELAARYSSARAFEETVSSVDSLSSALEKCRYATDSGMKSRLCSEAYAGALAAETAMSTLPFSNYELEQLTAFLNLAGDYAYTLSRQGGGELGEEQAEIMAELSEKAADFAAKLRELQGSVNSGELIMDSKQPVMGNVDDNKAELLSRSLLEYESGLEPQQIYDYDGRYNSKKTQTQGDLSSDEMKALAAAYAGVEVQQLKLEYEYAGEEGRQCYSAGDTLVCVSPNGVESLGQTRLVDEIVLSPQQAQKAAEDYLKEHGFVSLSLNDSRAQGAVTVMKFAVSENGALWPDNYIKIAIAMDDGSVYSLDTTQYSPEKSGAVWSIKPEQAAKAVPASLTVQSVEKIIAQSPGGEAAGCYSFSCIDENDHVIRLVVDGEDGKQRDISIGIE